MVWESFLEHLPKNGERIVIIHEWSSYELVGRNSTNHYTIYECNYKSFKKTEYNSQDMSLVKLTNLKIIGGEKLYLCLDEKSLYSKFLHWARLN